MSKTLENVDWELLHQQKLVLLKLRARFQRGSSEEQALSGIIHLVDALQDDAAADGRWQFPEEICEGDKP